MAQTLTTYLTTLLEWEATDDQGLSVFTDKNSLSHIGALTTGTGLNQANEIWHDERTLLGPGQDQIILGSLSRTVFGKLQTFGISPIKLLVIINRNTTVGDTLVIETTVPFAWTAPWNTTTGTIEIRPGGVFVMSNPSDEWTVGTSEVLMIENLSSNSVQYDIAIAGKLVVAG